MEIYDDIQGMQLALSWAEKALYLTSPNPRVGCVLVKDRMVIGAGHTQAAGQAHAEVMALADARQHGHTTQGATAYVTLEPCSHFGRTPPCCDALIQAGLAHVVVATSDPNPLVSGQGMSRLKAAGIHCEIGLLEAEANELNIGFFKRMRQAKPWVRLKTAASLDGVTALHNGQSQWITGSEARMDGHHWRARACAILTGIGTVLDDNPQLNVRAVSTPRQPYPVIVDSKLQIPLSARVLQNPGAIVVYANAATEKIAELEDKGITLLHLPNPEGKVDLPTLISELGRRQVNELHVEAGHKLNGSLIREHCVDELLLYVAPKLLGPGHGQFDLPELSQLDRARNLHFHQVQAVGQDLRILARF